MHRPFRHRLHAIQRLLRPVTLGILDRTTPVSDVWGFDRGTPIDRYYIENFLAAHGTDIRGRVLEVQSDDYALRFGNDVERRDVLDIDATNDRATLIADLAVGPLPEDAFDCFILTQTLHLIYDVQSAIRHVHRVLRPGGVLLLTVPTVSKISRHAGVGGDFWRFTPAACAALLEEVFGEHVEVHSYGNVLAAVSFLTGLAREELAREKLDTHDELFPVLVAARAAKR
jgi:SAM-dependent methyltransferase